MPILVQGSTITTTAQDIINCTSQDVRAVIQTTGADQAILLDYTSRIVNELLRFSRWKFQLSAPQVFLTTPGITDYWMGAGNKPNGTVDTGLELSDIFSIVPGEVIDRTQPKRLAKTDSPPVGQRFEMPGKPGIWRNAPDTPYILNIYPPPNQNTHQFIPKPAILSANAAGALPQRTYYVSLTFGDNCGGESVASAEQAYTLPAHFLLTVSSPVLPLTTDAVSLQTPTGPTIQFYNVYASTTPGGERKQVSSVALGTDWTEPTSGLISSGPAAPTQNTLAILGGYIIEFKYYQTRPVVTDVAQIIPIPDTYKDVVCAGVNWLTFKYLEMDENAQLWKSVFEAGKSQMVKDANLNPRGEEFIRPDSASISSSGNSGLGLDSGIESSLP